MHHKQAVDREDIFLSMSNTSRRMAIQKAVMNNLETSYEEAIAVIGMSCRFPDAENIDEFWRNLRKGRESVTFYTDEELIAEGADPVFLARPNCVKAACPLKDIELFDASFFGYSIHEAQMMDPQQRLMLECAWEALEQAGYVPHTYNGFIGLFAGMRYSGYATRLAPLLKPIGTRKSLEAALGTMVDQVAMRIGYSLNLRGPVVGIQTICSTSLVALHMACQSLRNGECDMALAGAASIVVPQTQAYCYDEENLISPDGHCRAFDLKARGTCIGNGLGIVLLKRFPEAVKDGDHIHAVIRGTAVNNDGSAKAEYRAPSLKGQTEVIAEALNMSEVPAESIGYFETNGTGTFIGDAIEVEAMTRAFRAQTKKVGFCAIGSVKTNIGHLVMASGIASLIKTILSLKHKELFPSLNFEKPNPSLKNSPFFVILKRTDWKTSDSLCRAGVNAFAIGGTNACAILEEAPSFDSRPPDGGFHILKLSAKSEQALKNLLKRYEKVLKENPQASLANICFTANIGRMDAPCRLAVVADSKESLYQQIRALSCRIVHKQPEHRDAEQVIHDWQCDRYLKVSAETGLITVYAQSVTKDLFSGKQWRRILECLGELYVRGTNVDWPEFYRNGSYYRVPLPTYPFERERCWYDPK